MNKPLVLGVDFFKGVLLYHSYDVSCAVKDPSRQTCYSGLKLCFGSWSPKLSKKGHHQTRRARGLRQLASGIMRGQGGRVRLLSGLKLSVPIAERFARGPNPKFKIPVSPQKEWAEEELALSSASHRQHYIEGVHRFFFKITRCGLYGTWGSQPGPQVRPTLPGYSKEFASRSGACCNQMLSSKETTSRTPDCDVCRKNQEARHAFCSVWLHASSHLWLAAG